ncbi:hypothetical protein SSX86_005752 [Deinandra increscens subsp. villosa]|uniref:RIN4 pathogenic type III effector avirulence factor Avr cleavage site domain-containing protein n=1 Tax=Deinandra increscens subsp. villosa TaxID=3103831 RepID=A0AAP0HC72_9ASTR
MQFKGQHLQEKGPPLPKFGDWDVNDPASAEGFTVIFNKARNEKKTGGTSDSPPKNDSTYNKSGTATLGKPQPTFYYKKNGSAAWHKGDETPCILWRRSSFSLDFYDDNVTLNKQLYVCDCLCSLFPS